MIFKKLTNFIQDIMDRKNTWVFCNGLKKFQEKIMLDLIKKRRFFIKSKAMSLFFKNFKSLYFIIYFNV